MRQVRTYKMEQFQNHELEYVVDEFSDFDDFTDSPRSSDVDDDLDSDFEDDFELVTLVSVFVPMNICSIASERLSEMGRSLVSICIVLDRASPRMIHQLWKLEMGRIYKGYLGRG